MATTLRRADRVAAILDRLARDGSVDVNALAAEFAVSVATVRRDLRLLDEESLARRTHGGATAATPDLELPVQYRVSRRRTHKQAIARRVLTLLPHGPLTVGLTGGTTTRAVARLLANRFGLTVVTNALNIAAELSTRPRLRLICTGGVSRTRSYELVGPIADRTIAGLNIDVAIVGTDGIGATAGLTTHDDIEAATNGAMIQQSRHVIAVADGSKLGRACLATICPIGRVDELVTDATADADVIAGLRAAGVAVHVAESDGR